MVNPIVSKICRYLLLADADLVTEEDLLAQVEDKRAFNDIIARVTANLRGVGLDLVRTTLEEGQKVYIVTQPGGRVDLDDELFGQFICLATLFKEAGNEFELAELEAIFPDLEKSLEQFQEKSLLVVHGPKAGMLQLQLGPKGKVLLKNVLGDLTFQKLIKWAQK